MYNSVASRDGGVYSTRSKHNSLSRNNTADIQPVERSNASLSRIARLHDYYNPYAHPRYTVIGHSHLHSYYARHSSSGTQLYGLDLLASLGRWLQIRTIPLLRTIFRRIFLPFRHALPRSQVCVIRMADSLVCKIC